MQLIQLKYEMIYEGFGGDKSRAPKIYLSENRLPILSLIKQQIRQIGELLSNADDYLVQRNLFGNYCVAIPPELCLCYDMQAKQICRFEDSIFGVGYWHYNLAIFVIKFSILLDVILRISINQIFAT